MPDLARIVQASLELQHLPLREWYQHMKAATQPARNPAATQAQPGAIRPIASQEGHAHA